MDVKSDKESTQLLDIYQVVVYPLFMEVYSDG